MKITVADLMIAIDTLNGSTSLVDRTGLFNYTNDTRRQVSERLTQLMCELNVDVELEKKAS